MTFLEAERYIGLDIDDRILAAGRDQLADDIVARSVRRSTSSASKV
jgi:hypothetical protein